MQFTRQHTPTMPSEEACRASLSCGARTPQSLTERQRLCMDDCHKAVILTENP